MDIQRAIENRRSIRRFSGRPVPRETVETVLRAAIEAPSAKNLQPWRFVVAQGGGKAGMADAMRKGIGTFPGDHPFAKWALVSARIMDSAPVTVFVLDPYHKGMSPPDDAMGMGMELSLSQSVGAAVQNMCLAATAQGLGSLWICDIFFAWRELGEWLGTDDRIACALALGYADESPERRPRKALDEVTVWR